MKIVHVNCFFSIFTLINIFRMLFVGKLLYVQEDFSLFTCHIYLVRYSRPLQNYLNQTALVNIIMENRGAAKNHLYVVFGGLLKKGFYKFGIADDANVRIGQYKTYYGDDIKAYYVKVPDARKLEHKLQNQRGGFRVYDNHELYELGAIKNARAILLKLSGRKKCIIWKNI